MGTAIALLAQFAVFWLVVAAIPAGSVAPAAWVVLYAVAALAFVHFRFVLNVKWSARKWFIVLFYSLFLAMFFYGANIGLDVLYGANRRKADVARYLGGLEIWFFLCPGVTAFAVAGLLQSTLSRVPQR
jgi:hypothetical protein